MRVLLVEDDRMIGDAMARALREAAYAADWVRDGVRAIAALDTHRYDLALLDIGLPGRDGHEVLVHIRNKHKRVAVLIVTARDELDQRLRGLDGGADDYVVKPFEMAELLARMRAVLRRKAELPHPVMTNGLLSLDPATHQVTLGEASIMLTGREFSLLHALMVRPGAILSRGELEDRIYGWNEEVASNAVEFLIHELRKKLGSSVIKNVRGVGWMVAKPG